MSERALLSKLERLVKLQEETNSLLVQLIEAQAMLIDAMAEDIDNDPDEPRFYMDGSPIRN